MTRRYIRNEFLAPDLIDASIDEVYQLVLAEFPGWPGNPVALAGGIAMQIYGSTRLTGDIDVIATDRIPGIRIEDPLAIVPGYQGRLPNGVQIDVILPDETTEWRDLFMNALRSAKSLASGGIPVVTPEYLVALKMMAGREEKDVPDLYFLLATPGVTDIALARRIVREELGKFAAKEFDALVEEARWATSRGKR